MKTIEIVERMDWGFEGQRRGQKETPAVQAMRSFVNTMHPDRRTELFQFILKKFPDDVDFLSYCSKLLDVPYAGQIRLDFDQLGGVA